MKRLRMHTREAKRNEAIRQVGDLMQSSASRLAEHVRTQIEHAPYEVAMAAYEANAAIEAWTALRKEDS